MKLLKRTEDPVKILDTMEGLVKQDILTHGVYLEADVPGHTCGMRACLVGTLWLASGAKPRRTHPRGLMRHLPGVEDTDSRRSYLRHRRGLRRAYEALNRAAEVRIGRIRDERKREQVERGARGPGPAEAYFEIHEPRRSQIIALIGEAREIVKSS